MSNTKGGEDAKDVKTTSGENCCRDDETESPDQTVQSDQSRLQEFIDIHHPPDRLGTPVEECGENIRRAGGSTIAEVTGKLSQQHVDSEDEYISAEEESEGGGGLDIPGDKFYTCVSDGVSDNNVSHGPGVVSDSSIGTNVDTGDSGSEVTQGACGGEEDDVDKEEDDKKTEEIVEDEEFRKKIEESLSDDEKLERKNKAQETKDQGNQSFREGSYKEAIRLYNEALQLCPLSFQKERSIMYSNKAACQMKLEETDEAIKSCSKALELHPHYMKALLRRAELHEKADKLDEALADYQKAVELDPGQHAARHAALRLADQVKERNEKLKAEMLGKLKDLGNMILKPFGMSTENFQLNQDPQSGSYSINFQQNPKKE